MKSIGKWSKSLIYETLLVPSMNYLFGKGKLSIKFGLSDSVVLYPTVHRTCFSIIYL